jgi:hypothetical protein
MPTPAGEHTNEFHCESCGRYFNTQAELTAHEGECRLAKVASPAGRATLEQEEQTDRGKNDSNVREFEHGTKRG